MNLREDGFAILRSVYSKLETDRIINAVFESDSTRPAFRKSSDLFAIRQFLKEVPKAADLIFNSNLKQIIRNKFGENYFVVKSIYFDKPENSNWFVAYHQDLTISVDRKIEMPGFGPWTVKQNQFAVQPPLEILRDMFTVRIHLDDTDETNGALKIIPGSHLKNIYRPETIDWNKEEEVICKVPAGGVMLMKPLLLHSSARSAGKSKRRVIHIEFSASELPHGLNWAERMDLDKDKT